MFQEVVHARLIVHTAIITAAKVWKHCWNVLFPLNEFPYQLFPLWLPVVCFCRSICCSDKEGVLANMFPLHQMEHFILKNATGKWFVCWYKYSQDTQCSKKKQDKSCLSAVWWMQGVATALTQTVACRRNKTPSDNRLTCEESSGKWILCQRWRREGELGEGTAILSVKIRS